MHYAIALCEQTGMSLLIQNPSLMHSFDMLFMIILVLIWSYMVYLNSQKNLEALPKYIILKIGRVENSYVTFLLPRNSISRM